MSQRFDAIVIGAGHNGLTAATLLAKKGRKVLVLEKHSSVGGLAGSQEFHPGFRTAGILHDTTNLRRWVVDELGLTRHGLQFRSEGVPVYIPQAAGRGLLLWQDPKRMDEELTSPKDAKAYREYRAFIQRMAPVVKRVFDEFPPDISTSSLPGKLELASKALTLRRLGKQDMMEIFRVAPMCLADWLNEYFESDLLKAALCGPALFSTFTAPWSAGTVANLLLAECLYAPPVKGGPQAVVNAMQAAAKAAGVAVRTGTEVRQVNVDLSGGTASEGKVTGVTLADGTVIHASQIAATCDPKTLFLKLVPPTALTQTFERNIANIRTRGTTAKLHLALERLPEWKGRPGLKVEYSRTGEFFDQLERAFDPVKYGQFSSEPVLDIYIPTLEAPELAPAGQHVMSVAVHYVPHALAGGWNDAQKDALYEAAIKVLEQYLPGIRGTILGKEVLTPVDLEARFGLSGGQLHHGEHALDQLLVRPSPECSRYATPFEGLFLCGSGAHPGGGVTGAPAGLAMKAMNG